MDELAQILNSIPALLSTRERDAELIATRVQVLLDALPPEEFLLLDAVMRQRDRYWYSIGLPGAAKFVALSLSFEPNVVAEILSCAWSGYTREGALRKPSVIRDGSELPFPIMRLADWVHVIKLLAIGAVQERVQSDYVQHFVRYLPLLLAVRKRQSERWAELTAQRTYRSFCACSWTNSPASAKHARLH